MSGYAEYTVNTPMFRGAFVKVFDPEIVKRKDKKTKEETEVETWKITMLFDEDEDLKELKDLAQKLMEDKFGDKAKWPKKFHAENNPNGWRVPWRKQWEKCEENPDIDKSYSGFNKKGLFVNASTTQKPEVVDRKVKDIIDKSLVYSGAYYIASVTLYWYDNESKGIGVSLNCLQKIKDGEPLGGSGISAAQAFSPVELDDDEDAGSVFDDEEDDEDDVFS